MNIPPPTCECLRICARRLAGGRLPPDDDAIMHTPAAPRRAVVVVASRLRCVCWAGPQRSE